VSDDERRRQFAADSQADVDAAWNVEIRRRVRAIQAGNAVVLDGDEVDRELAGILEEG
jgi:hypothetical protein